MKKKSATSQQTSSAASRLRRLRPALLPALLFTVCFTAYTSNGDFLPGFDQEGNMLLSVNLLKRHTLTLNADVAPRAFAWTFHEPDKPPRNVTSVVWEQRPDSVFPRAWLTTTNRYLLTPTTQPGEYANTFGPGAAISALPVYAALDLFTDIEANQFWWLHGGALSAALLTALTVLVLFLAARRFVAPLPAALAALAFGLGSCAWPMSSQALWQHPANSFFLALGAWCLLMLDPDSGGSGGARRRATRNDVDYARAIGCGAALGFAVICRPTSAVVVLCVGAWLLWARRDCLPYFVLGGLPFAALLGVYNYSLFGSPFTFGQTIASEVIVEGATGSTYLWQGAWRESLPGLLLSPSKGVAWYSPVLLFGFAGGALAWKTPHYRALLPLFAAVILLILIAGKWLDWGGGASYGHRSIVDTTPFLALCMLPVIERALAGRVWRTLFFAALLWSVSVQFVGAWAYSVRGWGDFAHNNPDKMGLWSLKYSPFIWHIANFSEQRAAKKELMAWFVRVGTQVIYVPER